MKLLPLINIALFSLNCGLNIGMFFHKGKKINLLIAAIWLMAVAAQIVGVYCAQPSPAP